MKIACLHCSQHIELDQSWYGQILQCPTCAGIIDVPQQSTHSDFAKLSFSQETKPRFVTVFGVLHIVFASLGLLCAPFGFAAMFATPALLNPSSGFKVWFIISFIIGQAINIWVVVLGIGLLKWKRWARTGSIAYAWAAIGLTAVDMAVNVLALAAGWIAPSPGATGGFVGGILGAIIALIYPILLLVFMRKSAAVASCTQ